MNEAAPPPSRGTASARAPRASAGAAGKARLLLGAGAAAGLWALAGFVGLGRSREGLSPVRELRPDLFAERSGGGVFVYGVRVGPAVLVFDAAADPRGRPLELLLTAMHVERQQVAGVWATNARPDHLAGAAALPDVPLFVGPEDLAVALGQRPLGSLFDRVLHLAWSPAAHPQARSTEPGTWRFGTDAATATPRLRAWATPGPTPGSVSYLFDDVLFVGDLLAWHEGKLSLPPRALDADPTTTRRSLLQLGRDLADASIGLVCTSHGGCTPEGQGAHAWRQLLVTLGAP